MGKETTYQEDRKKGLRRTKLVVELFNKLSDEKHDGRIKAVMELDHRLSGNQTLVTDTLTGHTIITDPKVRKNIRKFTGTMFKNRNSKMTVEENSEFIKDRVVWPVYLTEENIPKLFNMVTGAQLKKDGDVTLKPPESNPTALPFSLAKHPPNRPWDGMGTRYGLLKEDDIIEAFIKIINQIKET